MAVKPVISEIQPGKKSTQPSILDMQPDKGFAGIFVFFHPNDFPYIVFYSLSLQSNIKYRTDTINREIILTKKRGNPVIGIASSIL